MEKRAAIRIGFRAAMVCMLVATVAACNGGGGGGKVPVVTSVAVTPAGTSLAKGLTRQFTATATLSDNTTKDVSSSATWLSSAAGFATVSTTGLVKAENPGESFIRATVDGIQGSTKVTVTAATAKEVQVTPNSPSIPRGMSEQLTATLVMTDNTTSNVTATATWLSTAPGVATVDAAGLVMAKNTGPATISATIDGKTGSTVVTVVSATLQSIQVEPTSVVLPKGGFERQLKATGVFSDDTTNDITTQVLWVSSDETVATVSNAAGSKGLATSSANTAGTTNVTAKFGSTTSAAVVITVNADTLTGIGVTPAGSTIALGQSKQFTATGTFSGATPPLDITQQVTWTSSAESIATISNAEGSQGLAVSQSVGGPVTISAELNTVVGSTPLTVSAADLVSIAVSPATVILPKGFNRTFIATGTFSDGSVADVSAAVTWVSSNSNIATISNAADSKGVARGGAAGDTTISAVMDEVEGETSLSVTEAVLVSLLVEPDTVSIPLGSTQAFTATGVFDDGFEMDLTMQVTWASADANVATISNAAGTRGIATANAQGGPVAITAKRGEVTGTASLSVSSATITAVTVQRATSPCNAPTEPADTDTFLPKDFSAGFRACAEFTDGVTREVTSQAVWTSGATSVVVVSNEASSKGIASAVAEGRTVVVATLAGKSDSIPVEVTNATLTAIAVTPAGQTMVNGGAPIQYVATGTFSDANTLPITRHVTWSSSSDSVVISNAAGTQGRASPGSNVFLSSTVTITATRGTLMGSTTLTRSAGP